MQPNICDHIIIANTRTCSGTPGIDSSRACVSRTPLNDVADVMTRGVGNVCHASTTIEPRTIATRAAEVTVYCGAS
jgi:hypothetical protein